MTPFPGRAGAAAHPKVKRRPPFSVPAAAPDHDYGAAGREITPARPRRRLRGGCRARCPATATRRPCRRRPRPYPRGQYLGRLRDLQPSADLGPVGGAGGSAPAPAGRGGAPLRGRSGRRRALQGARRGQPCWRSRRTRRGRRPGNGGGVEARPGPEHGRDGPAAARRRRHAHPRARGRDARPRTGCAR